MKTGPSDADVRRAFRRFVLEHHPDRGGDPDVFRVGVAAYRAAGATTDTDRHPTVSVYRRRRGPMGVIHRLRRARRARGRAPRVE